MADQTLEQLQAQLEKAEADKKALQAKVAEAEKKIKDGDAVIEEMQNQINDQSEALKSSKTFPTVTVDKKKYEIRVVGKTRYKGKDYSAEDIKKSKELSEALVKVKASFMVAVEK
jgi:chromosome segregation ATPase